jgi:hypothetical protein
MALLLLWGAIDAIPGESMWIEIIFSFVFY